MPQPRIRHIALNVQNRDELAEYYKTIFGLEEKYRGPNGTIYLSDGFVGIALIHRPELPWGINHFGFEVEDVKAIFRRIAPDMVVRVMPMTGLVARALDSRQLATRSAYGGSCDGVGRGALGRSVGRDDAHGRAGSRRAAS